MSAEMRIKILQKHFFQREHFCFFLLKYILYVCPNSRAKRNSNISSFKKHRNSPLHFTTFTTITICQSAVSLFY